MMTAEWVERTSRFVPPPLNESTKKLRALLSMDEKITRPPCVVFDTKSIVNIPIVNTPNIHTPIVNTPNIHTPIVNTSPPDKIQPTWKCGNTLFWAIYKHENPKEEFLRPSAANVEIETRIKIVDSLKNTPKRLKDTNSKMTLESTQSLLGAMLTCREDKLDFCVAYSVYFGKHILVVYPNTHRIFSPSTTTDIEDDDHVIIVRAFSDGRKKVAYSTEPNPTKEMADTIMRDTPTLLKAQSNYKIAELESIAERFSIPTKTDANKRRKKEDVYNDIRLALHNDMNFVEKMTWDS